MAVNPFTGVISPGSYGPQVKALQQWLNSNGYPVAAAGQPGGPGMETENFGPATQAALQKFQAANGIVTSGDPKTTGYGNFGPKTMAAINQQIASTPASTVTDTGAVTGGPVGTSSGTTPQTSSDNAIQPAHVINDSSGSAYFANGNDALITIAGEGYAPQQLFFVDQTNKQIVPFSSMQSAINYFTNVTGGPVSAQEINAATTQVPSSVLGAGSALEGFVPVQAANGFDENGHLVNPAPSNANIQARYGRPVDQNAELKAYTALDGFSKLLQSANLGSTVTPQEITKLISDPTTMGFYINALAYGGYTLQDVYQEMVRQQAIDNGQGTSVMNSFPISTSAPASTYKASANYKSVTSNPALQVTPSIAGIDSSMLNNPVLQLPDEAFKAVSPLTDPNSPEFRQAMEQYKSATYDTAIQMSQAQSDSDHAKALADWKGLQEEIQSRLGITLADNAIQAWNQLDNFQAQAGQSNLGGSGMVQQRIDDLLKQQQSVNQSMRSYYSSYEDLQKESYYQNYASPDEIKALIASDPQRAQAWGLIPNDATKQYMTLDNLKALNPNTPEQDLQMILNKYLDPNGNFYSKIYGNYAANNFATGENYMAYQGGKVIDAATNKAGQALAQFSDPNNPFLKPQGTGLKTPTLPSTNTAAAPLASDAIKAIQGAAGNLGAGATPAPQQQAPTPQTTQKPPASTQTTTTPTPAPTKTTPAPTTTEPTTPVPNATSVTTKQPVVGSLGGTNLGMGNISTPVPSTKTSTPSTGTIMSTPIPQAAPQPNASYANASNAPIQSSIPKPSVALQPGSTNSAAVKQLQDFLVANNYMTPAQKQTGYGTYGPQTTAAVLAYQKAKGIDYSSGPGYWGPKTMSA